MRRVTCNSHTLLRRQRRAVEETHDLEKALSRQSRLADNLRWHVSTRPYRRPWLSASIRVAFSMTTMKDRVEVPVMQSRSPESCSTCNVGVGSDAWFERLTSEASPSVERHVAETPCTLGVRTP